jgi:RNA polymerase sigma-70 factor (ECF subfamily)
MKDPQAQGLLARIAALPGEPRIALPAQPDLRRDEHVDRLAGQLLQRFRDTDDPQAFDLLVRLTQPRLTALARRAVRELRPGAEAEDLVAGLYARLFTELRRDRPPVRNFLGLAHTALRNDALNQLRRQRRAEARGRAWQQLRAGECEPDPIAVADDREQAAHQQRLASLVLLVVADRFSGLPERDRLILQAREVDGLTYNQIAVTFGVPRGQVGMLVLRARKRLAARLREDLDLRDHARPGPAAGAGGVR